MIAFSKQLAESTGMPDANFAMIAIAPTLFFICLSSAYRGYFQGLQNMVPSAVSQVIEAVGKIGIGLIAGWYFKKVLGEYDPKSRLVFKRRRHKKSSPYKNFATFA